MGHAIVSAGNDAWVSQNFPTRNHGADKYLSIRDTSVGANGGVGLIYFRSPVPAGATVTSAKIRIRTIYATPNGSTATIALRRVIKSWSESRVTFNTFPTYTAGALASVSIPPATPSGTWLEFDMTSLFQSFANGLPNYGFRIDTTVQAGVVRLRGFGADYKPVLEVEWSDAPKAPTNLRPNGVVSVAKPMLSFDHVDVSGDKTIAAVQFQIDNDDTFATPLFDSGEVVADAPELNLAETAYAGLTSGVQVFYRARVKDGAGIWSEWSDDASLTLTAKPGVTILSPTAGVGFTESTPPILWSTPSQTAYRVVVDDVNSTKRIYDSGKRAGTEDSITLPTLPDDSAVKLTVQTWDAVANRVASPGDPTYSQASVTVGVNVDPTVDAPTGVTVERLPGGAGPALTIRWSRAAMPDSFVLLQDGKILDAEVEPADYTSDGTNYAYNWWGAKPNTSSVYTVRAVVNGKTSPDSTPVEYTARCEGIWLMDAGVNVALMGDDEGDWSMPEDATVYRPLGGKSVTRVVQGQSGWEGSMSGYIMDGFGYPYADNLAALYTLKNGPMRTVRMCAGDTNFRALIGDITVNPVPQQRDGQIYRKVSFSFWQVDDFEF